MFVGVLVYEIMTILVLVSLNFAYLFCTLKESNTNYFQIYRYIIIWDILYFVFVSGLYVFTWTIREHNGSQHSVTLVINNEEYGAVYQRALVGEYDQCSTTVVLHLNQGDDVYLRTKNGGGIPDGNLPMMSNPWGRTSFSGWKIN